MATSQVEVREEGDRIQIQAPYDRKAVEGFKRLGGKWDSSAKIWVLGTRERNEVLELLGTVYGWVPPHVSTDMILVEIEAKKLIQERQDGVRVAGRTIARARGRDSGARLGDDVRQVSGNSARSGGSFKNWVTIIPEGARFRLELPLLAAEDIDRREWDVTYGEIVQSDAPATSPREELAALLPTLSDVAIADILAHARLLWDPE